MGFEVMSKVPLFMDVLEVEVMSAVSHELRVGEFDATLCTMTVEAIVVCVLSTSVDIVTMF